MHRSLATLGFHCTNASTDEYQCATRPDLARSHRFAHVLVSVAITVAAHFGRASMLDMVLVVAMVRACFVRPVC
jgi:hypothetical protein